MALEWLKTILGDKYTPDIDAAVSQEIGKGFVARTDFNAKAAKVTELEAQVTQLTESVKTRDTQLADLKKSAGDNADLQKQIDTLTAGVAAAGDSPPLLSGYTCCCSNRCYNWGGRCASGNLLTTADRRRP